MIVLIAIFFSSISLVLWWGELQIAHADCSIHAEAEYRRTPSPQANNPGAWRGVANFPFPGIMGQKKQSKDNKNEKTFRYATRKEGKSP
jgi:hypothetical protein